MDNDLERAVAVMYSPHSPYHKKPAPPAPTECPLALDFAYSTNPWLASTPLAHTAPAPTDIPPQHSPRARALAEAISAPSQPLADATEPLWDNPGTPTPAEPAHAPSPPPECEDMPMSDLLIPDLLPPPPRQAHV